MQALSNITSIKDFLKISVFGAGTWGTALASLLFKNGHEVSLWSAIPQELELLKKEGRHINLPGAEIPSGIIYTKNLSEACEGKELLLFATASGYLRETVKNAAPYLEDGIIIASATKGIEKGTLLTMSELIEDELSKRAPKLSYTVAAISGPTHAEEVAVGLPTSMVAASLNENVAMEIAKALSNSYMRVYTNTDIRGVELAGAFKNIIALAAGINRGMGFGDNSQAMLMTRGIAEITRIGLAMGSERATFMGLAGIGDLIVTCTSHHSRNNRCGELIGKGFSYEEASREIGMVVEGYHALEAGVGLAKKYGVEMPITNAVYDVIMNGEAPKEAMSKLMSRDLKSELENKKSK